MNPEVADLIVKAFVLLLFFNTVRYLLILPSLLISVESASARASSHPSSFSAVRDHSALFPGWPFQRIRHLQDERGPLHSQRALELAQLMQTATDHSTQQESQEQELSHPQQHQRKAVEI